jgi:anaerobic magnesium-protoporphyrin IX monomethyl ester cyclase
VGLIRTWEQTDGLSYVDGITWRNGQEIVSNRSRTPIQDLDAYRPGWELVDWPRYSMFGFTSAAGLQFSRGCTLTCSYCGQWMFWKKWRHRSPENVVEQLKLLSDRYGVKIVWFADENFAADQDIARRILELIIDADLGLSLNLNMTAADVVRDADLIPLYKRAGVDYIVMGVESLKDDVIAGIRKNNPLEISKEAVRLLRENNIISLTNIIYGLEEERWKTIFEKFKGLLELDSDILNAMYLTPHFWTSQGKATEPYDVIQLDQDKWSYRNQVIATRYLPPIGLFLGVKLTEILFHLRPKALKRLALGKDKRYLQIMRHSMWVGLKVILAEIVEFFFDTRFSPQGSMKALHGVRVTPSAPADD